MPLTLAQAVKRRFRLIPVIVALTVRGVVLLSQPFPSRDVPAFFGFLCLFGAAVLAGLLLWRRPWSDIAFGVGAAATTGPYLCYVGWVLTWIDLRGIGLATVVDLTLIPFLVAGTWGKTRVS